MALALSSEVSFPSLELGGVNAWASTERQIMHTRIAIAFFMVILLRSPEIRCLMILDSMRRGNVGFDVSDILKRAEN
jgi:hypothetical protein